MPLRLTQEGDDEEVATLLHTVRFLALGEPWVAYPAAGRHKKFEPAFGTPAIGEYPGA